MFDFNDSMISNAVIKVVGVGGGGGNAVQHMCDEVTDVEFFALNTDGQALSKSKVQNVLQIGTNLTKGLGAGANPEIGKRAATEDRAKIEQLLEGADMVFITAGMGGGTGTGGAPVVAEVAREMGILTVAVVTKPFPFEGPRRMKAAEAGIEELTKHVDSIITVPNEKLLSVLGKGVSLIDAFNAANDVLGNAVKGVSELITRPGLINVDFADVRAVMTNMGLAMMGMGEASGENRAREAAEAAISSPLLEDINLDGAKGVIVNITAGMDMSIGEFEEVGEVIRSFISDDAIVIAGTVIDPEMSNSMKVTVVVTGIEKVAMKKGFGLEKSVQQPQRESFSHKPAASFLRRETEVTTSVASTSGSDDANKSDIPSFLRRKQ
ncbi:cell division protein FtsZ [Allofrancisella guangzhouensis]|uniref:Cell division protein FtsZ n=1 Tax=Allofrancisella guangzhouensis TaxID=594679 RepID=A0A0A8E3C6_9GAMM|nr:cell division protein FtsZ [Allofrancisella guangzhouensis]AJC48464.1 cell division protein FtsZ [Allofrancisella guangzhouensis]MBK2027634.1 cell division protein FtsZ [Allofrancisella guangzhouensis]MBK2044038.1 cell division protein FtsZ [Allofrancisella guangzhouensis]MBK2046501.1 cell division protein FtsZ [Allofrancisella guangzhouensis]